VQELLQVSPWVKYCVAAKGVTTDDQHKNGEGARTWGIGTYGAFSVLRLLTARPVREAYLRQLSFLEPGLSVNAKRLPGEASRLLLACMFLGVAERPPDLNLPAGGAMFRLESG
jgi:hypothetical protein